MTRSPRRERRARWREVPNLENNKTHPIGPSLAMRIVCSPAE